MAAQRRVGEGFGPPGEGFVGRDRDGCLFFYSESFLCGGCAEADEQVGFTGA